MEIITNNFKASDTKEFEFAVIIETIDLNEATGDPGYLIICGASKLPKYLTKKQRTHIAQSMSVEDITVEDVYSYGLYTQFEDIQVETKDQLETELERIRKQVPAYASLCGFYFDRQLNKIGNTGWDFLNGKIG